MEKDKEIKGDGNSYTTEFRQYDPRLGRWLSLDPLMACFPDISPYVAFANNPVYYTDIYGLSPDGDPPGGNPNATPDVPNEGYECYDDVADEVLSYNGDGEWCTSTTGNNEKDEMIKDIYKEVYYEKLDEKWCGNIEGVFVTPKKGNSVSAASGEIGGLSANYESRGGVGTVSTGKGDPGGVSYGAWQFATNRKIPQNFLKNEGSVYKDKFEGLTPGTSEFSKVWKQIAKDDPVGFRNVQYLYTKRAYYDAHKSYVDRKTNLNVDSRPAIFKDIIWSLSVQHGPNNTVIRNALKGKNLSKMTDEEIIRAIYTERMNLQKYFPSTTDKDTQESLIKRFNSEMNDAIKSL